MWSPSAWAIEEMTRLLSDVVCLMVSSKPLSAISPTALTSRRPAWTSFINAASCCEIGAAEALLPRVLLNSSAFHNLHHERVVTHFGEISSFWDYACGTSDIYAKGLGTGYRWHVARSAGMQGPGLTA